MPTEEKSVKTCSENRSHAKKSPPSFRITISFEINELILHQYQYHHILSSNSIPYLTMIAVNHSPTAPKSVIRSGSAHSYDRSTEPAAQRTRVALHPGKHSDKNPLDLLSSAASAVVDDEESTASSTVSLPKPQGMITSSFTLSPSRSPASVLPQKVTSRHPPVAYVVRPSPPRSFLVSPGPSPTLVPQVPSSRPLPAFPAPQEFPPGTIPMPEGMEMTMSHPTTVLKQRELLPMAVTSSIHKPVRDKSAPLKRHNPKSYRMKYHCVSMRRSEALKYIEAVSNGNSSRAQYYLDHGHQKPIPVASWKQPWSTPRKVQSFRPIAVPASMSSGATASHHIYYHLPSDKAVVPPY